MGRLRLQSTAAPPLEPAAIAREWPREASREVRAERAICTGDTGGEEEKLPCCSRGMDRAEVEAEKA